MPTTEEIARGAQRPDRKKKGKSGKDWPKRPLDESRRARWSNASPSLIGELVQACARADVGVLFGATRDASALVVSFYEDGVKDTRYISPSDNLDEVLLTLTDRYLPPVETQLTMPL